MDLRPVLKCVPGRAMCWLCPFHSPEIAPRHPPTTDLPCSWFSSLFPWPLCSIWHPDSPLSHSSPSWCPNCHTSQFLTLCFFFSPHSASTQGSVCSPCIFSDLPPFGPQPNSQVPLSPPLPHLLWIPCPFTSFPDPNAQLSNGYLHRDCPSSAQTQCIQKQIHCHAFKGSSPFKNYSFYPGDIILPVNHFTSVVPCHLKHSQTPSPDNSRDSEFNLPFQRPLPCTTVLT